MPGQREASPLRQTAGRCKLSNRALPPKRVPIAHCFCAPAGKYKLSKRQVEFSKYMEEEGYHIIKISAKHQLVSLFLHNRCIHVSMAWQLGPLLKQMSGSMLVHMHAVVRPRLSIVFSLPAEIMD